MTGRGVPGAVVRAVGLPLLLLGLLAPFVPLVLWATARRYAFPALLPTQTSSRPVRLLLDPGSEVLRGLLQSLEIAVSVAVVACAIGLCAGRAMGVHAFRGKRVVQFLLLAPVIVPGLAIVLPLDVRIIRAGLDGTVRGVVLVHLLAAVPYVTLVMSSVFANLDLRLEEQARTLGAGPLQVLVRVTLPSVAPGMAVAALFAFLLSWGEYVLALTVGAPNVKTLPVLLYAYVGSSDLPVAAALGLALVVPPVLLLTVTSRFLSGGGSAVAGFGRV